MVSNQSRINLPFIMSEITFRPDTYITGSPTLRIPFNLLQSPRTMSPYTISNLSPSPSSKSFVACSDRFIPCRSSSRLHTFGFIDKTSSPKEEGGGANEAYKRLLRAELFGSDFGSSSLVCSRSLMCPNQNMLRFKTDTSGPSSSSLLGNENGYYNSSQSTPPKPRRKVPKTPHEVFYAPSLQDDFYLNLLDWSSQNVVAVGLDNCVYFWTGTTGKVTELCDLGPNDSVCSVQWTRDGSYISIGTSLGQVQVWDASECKMIRSMGGHQSRTGVLAWSSRILSSGGRDRNILHHDLRVPNDFISKLTGHKSEVCGLKWSYDDRELASGGNDSKLLIWNLKSQQPVLKWTEHTAAAVKAITWSPYQYNLLASGGGTDDHLVRFWNTKNGNQVNCIDTGSQVCNLAWSKNVNEIISTHGYPHNQIMVWKYPSLAEVATLNGHSKRVLYLAMSPDGQTIVTGAGDEKLKFWNVFPLVKKSAGGKDTGLWSLGRSHIR